MRGDRFLEPARVVEAHGLVYLFGGPKAGQLPNLHHEIAGSDEIVEWTPETDLVWECRGELPRRGLAWYGEWLRGRGTFVAARVLPAALAWAGRTADEEQGVADAAALGPDPSAIYEAILTGGPSATVELRRACGLAPARFKRTISTLQRTMLVTHHGARREGAGWPSSVFEVTARAFPLTRLPGRNEALAVLLDTIRTANPELPEREAELLLGATP